MGQETSTVMLMNLDYSFKKEVRMHDDTQV